MVPSTLVVAGVSGEALPETVAVESTTDEAGLAAGDDDGVGDVEGSAVVGVGVGYVFGPKPGSEGEV